MLSVKRILELDRAIVSNVEKTDMLAGQIRGEQRDCYADSVVSVLWKKNDTLRSIFRDLVYEGDRSRTIQDECNISGFDIASYYVARFADDFTLANVPDQVGLLTSADNLHLG